MRNRVIENSAACLSYFRIFFCWYYSGKREIYISREVVCKYLELWFLSWSNVDEERRRNFVYEEECIFKSDFLRYWNIFWFLNLYVKICCEFIFVLTFYYIFLSLFFFCNLLQNTFKDSIVSEILSDHFKFFRKMTDNFFFFFFFTNARER